MTSVRTKEGQTEGFLFLLGVEPALKIILSENLVLEPVKCHPDPEAMIDSIMKYGSQSEIDLGILIATLRLTRAQLHVRSSDPRSLVASLWNAQTDICLLSALLHREIYWNLQCDVSADQFDRTSSMHAVMSSRLFLPHSFEIVSPEECSFIERSFSAASTMMNNSAFSTAVNALWSYRQSLRPSVQLAILWAGIESIFDVRAELRFRISLLASKFLDGDKEEYTRIKRLYDDRSKAVHEGNVRNEEAVSSTASLLHKLILKCIERKALPIEDDILFG